MTAKFEKRSPLPPGRYYIDVVGVEKIKQFFGLLNPAVALGVVVIENVETNSGAFDLQSILQALDGDTIARVWVLFRVTGFGTLSIDAKTFGFPTIAADSVHTESDTETLPPDPTVEAASTVRTIIGVLEGIAAVLTVKTVLDMVKGLRK